MIAVLCGASISARAQTNDSITLRGMIAPQESQQGTGRASRAKSKAQAATKKTTSGSAGTNGAPVSGAGGMSSVALDNSLGDVGAPPSQPLGGMGDVPPRPLQAGRVQPAVPELGTEEAVPLGGLGDQPTQSEAARIVAQAAENATHQRLSPPQPPETNEGPRAGTIAALAPYAPAGTSIGSFVLYSELTGDFVFTDNVMSTKTDPKSDWGPELKPDFRLQSNWTRHFLSFEFNADRLWYQNYPVEDVNNYQAVMKGRYDLGLRTHVGVELEKSQEDQGRNGQSLPDANVSTSNLQEQHALTSFAHRFNRVGVGVAASIANYDYKDVTLISGQPATNDNRDYLERDLKLRGAYRFRPGFTGFVESTLNNRTYTVGKITSGYTRGSSGYTLQAGTDFRFGGKVSGTASIGYGAQNPIDNRLKPVNGVLLNADILWRITGLTSLSFQARTDLDETSLTDASGAFTRFYGGTLSHHLRSNVIVGTFLTYETADYVGQAQHDERFRQGGTLEYLFNRNLAMVADYTHTHFTSTYPDSNYDSNEVTVGLRLRK